jgi:hypothetical protein
LLVAVFLSWFVSSSVWIYPHSLSYFNESVGGPRNGANHLLGSGVDWGQDLRYLKQWLERFANGRPVYLAYFGHFDPKNIGIDYVRLTSKTPKGNVVRHVEPGLNALSINVVMGYPCSSWSDRGPMERFDGNAFSDIREVLPTAWMGYSICVYDIIGR